MKPNQEGTSESSELPDFTLSSIVNTRQFIACAINWPGFRHQIPNSTWRRFPYRMTLT